MPISESVMFGIFAMMSYGLADFLTKKAVGKYNEFTALKISLASGTVALLIYSLLFVPFPTVSLTTTLFILLTGALAAVGWIAFYKGLKVGKVSIVSPIASSWGLVPFILAILILSERLTLQQTFLSAIIFVGIFLVSVRWKEFVSAAKKRFHTGAGLALFAMVTFGLSGFFTKFVVNELDVFYTVIFVRMVATAVVFILAKKSKAKEKMNLSFIWILISIGILDTLGYLSFNIGLSTGIVSIVSAITSTAPLVAVVLAYPILKEKLSANQYLGIILIISGLVGLSFL